MWRFTRYELADFKAKSDTKIIFLDRFLPCSGFACIVSRTGYFSSS